MLNRQLASAFRIALLGVFAVASACAESDPEPAAGLLTDYASGVDAAFGVQTFALGPTLEIVSPTEDQAVPIQAGQTTIAAQFKVTGFNIGLNAGKIQCYVNGQGGFKTAFTVDPIANETKDLGKMGLKTLVCHLVDAQDVPLTDTAAKATVHFKVIGDCNLDKDCDDGEACSDDSCEDQKCNFKWKAGTGCCMSSWDCDNLGGGETCDTQTNKCTNCQADLDCDDQSKCTVDKCDLSGAKGKCTNIKVPDDCNCKEGLNQQQMDAECDDGKPCTIDKCDGVAGKCSHVLAAGACCEDAECKSPDVCHEALCVEFECRLQKDKFKPECCLGDGDCNDKHYCTLDKCEKAMETGGIKWTQCTHVTDVSKNIDGKKCCDPAFPTACEDENSCTFDICNPNYLCENKEIGDCCKTVLDCDDDDFCTVDSCDTSGPSGKCVHAKTPECCHDNPDCDDGKYCTGDSCNVATNTCKHLQSDPNCCDFVADCDDGKFCTAANCVNHSCFYGPDKFKPNCCEQNSECNDANPCTNDTCDTGAKQCKFVDGGDVTCCNSPSDCDDGDCATLDFCDAANTCAHKKDVTKCAGNIDCDDGDPCTIDKCDNSGACGLCTHEVDPKCCVDALQCNDSKACTQDLCKNNLCEYAAVENCCESDEDALVTCDDNSACTIDYCLNNQCRHTAPKNKCCVSKADCDDGDKCTTDSCGTIDQVTKVGACTNVLINDCKCTVEGALLGIECNDGNICTTDVCTGGLCTHNAVNNCCLDKFDCDDGAPCTYDACVFDKCMNYEIGGDQKLCCTKETEASDCAFLASECAKGICEEQPDGARKCTTVPLDICTVAIGYCQDFSAQPSLKGNGWNPGDVKGGAAKNWSVGTDGKLGPDAFAAFTWTPTHTNFDTCLQSPVFQAAGSKQITMQYDQFFDINQPGVSLRVLGSLNGAIVDWTKATVVDATVKPASDLGPATIDLTLPPALTGSNGLRLAFCLSGDSTFDLTSFQLDNICVVKGGKPVISSCPPNQIVPHGKTKSIPIKAKDPDADAILSFSIVKGPAFAYLTSALYFWLDASWNSTLVMTPTSLDDVGTHEITIKVSDGFLYSLCTFQITVTYEGGFLVWRPTEVPPVAGDAIYTAVKKQSGGKVVQHLTDLGLYPDLSGFIKDGAIFVTLGVYPDNHVLNENEVSSLKLYLQGGGKLYMEGGDTWAFDKQTSLHPFFNVKPQGDTSVYGITGPLKGDHVYRNINSTPIKKYNWEYDQGFAWNNVNDQLLANAAVADTRNILLNEGGQEKYQTQVAHDDKVGFRTVASSLLFGGVKAGATGDNANKMIGQVIEFFINGFIDCKSDSQCDDGNGCTADKCLANSKCEHKNTCQCTADENVLCDQTIVLDNTDSAATKKIDSYSCGGGIVFDGNEHAHQFETDASKPVTLEVVSLDNTSARVLVVRGDASGCNPDQCVALSNKTFSFAGAKGSKYFLILDAPAGASAKASVKITCGKAEICDDKQDNNGNGLVDCADLASCCGDAACGEVCDDLDNDCNGKTDEFCNVDGDGYCALDKTVVGSPAICSKGGGDCNDDDATVNPGNEEICLNGKDDNCDGNKDEDGAAGCTNYYNDEDGDTYGAGVAACKCEKKGNFGAILGGDCNDADKAVNPGATEICNNNVDDDCTGTQNDQNAIGCTDFYTDTDQDGWGTVPKKCLCFGEGVVTATKPGDCEDTNSKIYPDFPEVCNNGDDNCNGIIDEGCDDDKDGYCDVDLGYVAIGANKSICASANQTANLSLQCEPGATITNVLFASYGTPTGGCAGDDMAADNSCHATASLQKLKASCLGKANCIVPATDAYFGGDPCPEKNTQMVLLVKAVCTGSGGVAPDVCPKGAGDSDDTDPTINPEGKEICDGQDNNSDGLVDEGCDDDGDEFCDINMIVIGAPAVCPKGQGDCDDTKSFVNPGKAENCLTPEDDNCNDTNNDVDALNCQPHFYDNDKDAYGTKDFKCICAPIGLFSAKKTADCDDYNALKNPGLAEICDNIDNDCDGVADNGCDNDGDGYCDAGLEYGAGGTTKCPNGAGDCDDENKAINPSVLEICGDGVDNNCNGTQNDAGATGCVSYHADLDSDGYGTSDAKCLCQPEGNFKVTNDKDCNDNNAEINPLATEICDAYDNNCDTAVDEGCDDDKDGFCDANMLMKATAQCGGSKLPAGQDDYTVDAGNTYKTAMTGLSQVGTYKSLACPAGHLAIGFEGNAGNWVDSIRLICADLADTGTLGSQTPTGWSGTSKGGTPFGKKLCPEGMAMVNMKLNVGNFVDRFEGICMSVKDIVAKKVNAQASDSTGAVGGNGGTPAAHTCKDGYAVTGFHGHSGEYPEKTGFMCTPVVYKKISGTSSGDDCDDNNPAVNPGVQKEACDGADDDCNGVADNGCDKDEDGYCDATHSISNPAPAACPKGGGDCNDFNNDQNPGHAEVCGNAIDDDCDGSQNNENAINCTKYYFDGDGDKWGLNLSKCLCTPAGSYQAIQAGDCDDLVQIVNPGMKEVCGDFKDNDCSGTENDENADKCVDFYFDADDDGYGLSGLKKCLCVAEGEHRASKSGDCNDLNKAVNPGSTEVCDDVDNDCNSKVDEGCNDDGDKFCDASMTTVGLPNACPLGGGDCDDTQASVNPGHTEICDNFDNNCNGSKDEKCDDDNDDYCDADMLTVGNPSTCSGGGGDCADDNAAINPGVLEKCSTLADDDCSGTTNDPGADGCKNFGLDYDGDTYADKDAKIVCLCLPEGNVTGTKTGDCDDKQKFVNPGITEICDGIDNNCDGQIDEGCDNDGDGYCDAAIPTIGKPANTCPNGGGDCNDDNKAVHPGAVEVCNDNVDNNCDGSQNDIDAQGCTKFWYDSDNDGWAVQLAQCLCKGANGYTQSDPKKVGDCDDTEPKTNPDAPEICGDGLDNNCNGTQNDIGAQGCKEFYVDTDKDGYGAGNSVCRCVAEGVYVTALGGDCNPTDPAVSPGTEEICDDKDNNCAQGIDEGCNDDSDPYCDVAMKVVGKPNTCPAGGGDCNDLDNKINPSKTERCDDLDQNCDGVVDDGCDDDKDGYCDIAIPLDGNPAICPNGGKDCNDGNSLVNPSKTEICDDADNNCDNIVDEGCDDDSDGYCTTAKSIIGIPKVCPKGGGDCNDIAANAGASVNPGAKEICDGLDNNCAAGIDEVCKDLDGDGYCIGISVISPGCPKGGNDCDDGNDKVNPGATEDCATEYDDNCNKLSNEVDALNCKKWYTDADGDTYGDDAAVAVCRCFQSGNVTATKQGDCNDTDPMVKPGATEVCDGKDNNCNDVNSAPPKFTGQVINMNTYSHGGMYHPAYKEYWYPQWSGQTVYRYDAAYQSLGTFTSGQNCMMGLYADNDGASTDYYTANWGYNTITRRKGKSSSQVWSFNIGSTAADVTTDAQYAYATRNSTSTIWILNKTNGQQVKTMDLNGGTPGQTYGGMAMYNGKLYYGHQNGTVSRYDPATMIYDGTQFTTATNIYNMAFNGIDYCISANNSSVYCYRLKTEKIDEGCDDDNDGYCNNAMLLEPGGLVTCPKSGLSCDGIVIGNRCYKAHDGAKTWPEAEVACSEWGGKLASLHSAADNAKVTAEAKNICGETKACDGTTIDGYCYKAFKDVAQSWKSAEEYCGAWGGNLASVHSDATNAKLLGMAQATCGGGANYWLGLNDQALAGVYRWNDGTPFDHNNWDSDQPDNKSAANEKMISASYDQTLTKQFSGSGAQVSFDFLSVPAVGAKNMKITTWWWGDYNSGSENGTVYVDGKSIGQVGGSGAQCHGTNSPGTRSFTISESDALNWTKDGKMQVRIQNTGSVGSFCNPNQLRVRIEFSHLYVEGGAAEVVEGNIGSGKWNDVSPVHKRQCFVCKRVVDKAFWIGFTDKDSEGTWGWSNGTPANYKNWAAGEPNPVPKFSHPFPNSALVNVADGLQINAWVGKQSQVWKRCYSKKTDGSSSSTFHNNCNNKGPTVSIFKSTNGNVYGGYFAQSWTSANNYRQDSNSFLFSVDKASKHKIINTNYAVYDTNSYGPTFGGGHDIYTNSNMNYQYTYFGHSYECPFGSPGNGSCQTYFSGTYSGNYIDDIEVWYAASEQELPPASPDAGQDYARVNIKTGTWSDHEATDGGACYVCSRPVTSAQFGKGDDCDDDNALLNPGNNEVCDGEDNNCNGLDDEGCDDDGDGYCDSAMGTKGAPSICPKGGNDCDDTNNAVSPQAVENCTTPYDDNCDGSYSDLNAKGCTKFYADADGDGYGTSDFQCICPASQCKGNIYAEPFDDPGTKGYCSDNKGKECKKDNDCIAGKCEGYAPPGLQGWTFSTCDAGNLATPTNCKVGTPTKGWQHAPNSDLARSVPGSLYYGDLPNNNFNFGASAGVAMSPKVKVPAVSKPKLLMSLFMGTEESKSKDLLYINVFENGKRIKTLWSKASPPPPAFKSTKLLNTANVTTLNNWAGVPGQQWKLCYSKSTHGGSSSTFHNNCNNKGETYTIVKSTYGKLYGGYFGQSWRSVNNYVFDTNSFLFSLSGNTKHPIWRQQYAVYDNNSYGPTFGGGHDLYIDSGMNYGYTYFGWTYQCPWCNQCVNGTCQNYLAGSYSGNYIQDVEVFYKDGKGGFGADVWMDLDIDLTPYLGKELQFEIYFQTVDGNANTGLGVVVDDFKVVDTTCDKYQAENDGDCNDDDPLIFPSKSAEVCDGEDNDCNGEVDEECDSDKDGFCNSAKPMLNNKACPNTGTVAGPNCKIVKAETPKYIGNLLNMDTRSHGGGYHPKYGEYWYPQWSGTTVYRYSPKQQMLGTFNSGQNCMMQLWADTSSDDFYTANWGYNTVTRIKGKSSNRVWTRNIGSTSSAVTTNDKYAYAMWHYSNRVHVLDKNNGNYVANIYLSGGNFNTTYGGLAMVDGKLWRGGYDRIVYEYDLSKAQTTGKSFNTAPYIYNMAYNGKEYCVSQNNSEVYCYAFLEGSCSKGDDCDDSTSSIKPGSIEVCDDADNDCNGTVDDKCDEDDDGYCDASKPTVGAPFTCPQGGGDCDDKVKATNPGAGEICDGKDNNCNSVIDEGPGAGCTDWYYDGDQDGYGTAANKLCLCKSSGLYTTKKAGDCKDDSPQTYPGATEICDGNDNDCDSSVDEGCDKDGDGYCDAKLLTIGQPAVCPGGGNDCNDASQAVHPGAIELCNNADENCNGEIDEGAVTDDCIGQAPKNATMACVKGKCAVFGCKLSFFDINGIAGDGCECNGNDAHEPNEECAVAANISSNLVDTGQTALVAGKLVDAPDVDWYKFYAVDKADTGNGSCDSFNVRVRFLANPSNSLALEIHRGSCPTNTSSVCCGKTDFNWFTNFKGHKNNTYSSYHSEWGECPCAQAGDYWSTRPGYNSSPSNGGPWCKKWTNGVCIPRGYDYTKCTDDSRWFYVKVYKKILGPQCSKYQLEVTNGVYGAPGHLGYSP